MRAGALKKRLRSEGLDGDAVEAIDDEDEPKVAAIELLVEMASAMWAAEADAAAAAADAARLRAKQEAILRAELQGLKLRELKTRALHVGMCADKVDDVDDEDNPKAAIIELLVAAITISEAAKSADDDESDSSTSDSECDDRADEEDGGGAGIDEEQPAVES